MQIKTITWEMFADMPISNSALDAMCHARLSDMLLVCKSATTLESPDAQACSKVTLLRAKDWQSPQNPE